MRRALSRPRRTPTPSPIRNQRLLERFGVTGYPTIVLTDAQGRPYGFENYVHGGVSAFMQAVRRHQAIRQRRDQALSRVESARGPPSWRRSGIA